MILSNGERLKKAQRVTWFGFFVNVFLTIIKFIAGFLGRSSAMIADAVHSFSDIASDLAVLIGLKAAEKPRDEDHDYGHGKFETLVTAFIGLFLLGVAGGMIFNSGRTILDFIDGNGIERPGWIAVAAAFLSMMMKEGVYHISMKVAKDIDSKALKANAWHHRTDSLSSLAVLLGVGGAILLGGDWVVLDPLAAIVVSLIIFKVAYDLLKDSILELTEASLSKKEERSIIELIKTVKGAKNPHNLRTRRIGKDVAIDVHVKAPGDISLTQAHDIAQGVEMKLKDEYGEGSFVHVHMDPDHL